MKNPQTSYVNNSSATTHGTDGALTRRESIGASVLRSGLLGLGAKPLIAECTVQVCGAVSETTGETCDRCPRSPLATLAERTTHERQRHFPRRLLRLSPLDRSRS